MLVISPLLALMRDQYEKLLKLGVPCIRLDGTIRGKKREEALNRIRTGEPVLVMTTPETLGASDASEALVHSGLSLAAVDEAHCISEWGYDFRPAYLQIGERLRTLGGAPVLALTATATEKVRSAIQRFVGMDDPRIVASSPHRSNLAFDVLLCSGGARHRALARLALRVRRPGIIYCSTTREVDELHAVLQRFGVPCYRYHGKMSSSERSKSQDGFMQRGRRTVMVATNAFGLGIDKPDIRYVMHYQAPASLEQYVQEAGRAGRDGRRANCIMLYSPEDRAIHEALLSRSRVRPEQLYKLGRALAAWAGEEKIPNLESLALSAELGTRTTGALLALLEEATLVRWDTTAVFVTVPADEIEERSRELAGQFETLRTQDVRRLDAVAAYAMHRGLPGLLPSRVLRGDRDRRLWDVRPLPGSGGPARELLGAAGPPEGGKGPGPQAALDPRQGKPQLAPGARRRSPARRGRAGGGADDAGAPADKRGRRSTRGSGPTLPDSTTRPTPPS